MEIAFVDPKWIVSMDYDGRKLRELAPYALHSGYDAKKDRAWGIWASFFGYASDQIRKGCKKTLSDLYENRYDLFGQLMSVDVNQSFDA